MRVVDSPHEEYYVSGVPVLDTSDGAGVIKKQIRSYDIRCPDCLEDVQYDEDDDPVCSSCGRMFARQNEWERLVYDAKSAGRL